MLPNRRARTSASCGTSSLRSTPAGNYGCACAYKMLSPPDWRYDGARGLDPALVIERTARGLKASVRRTPESPEIPDTHAVKAGSYLIAR